MAERTARHNHQRGCRPDHHRSGRRRSKRSSQAEAQNLIMSQLANLSAAEMAQRVRLRKISPVELVRAHLAAIEQLNPKLNAFLEVRAEQAIAKPQAAESIIMRGEQVGPLHGVPLSIKSSIAVAGC